MPRRMRISRAGIELIKRFEGFSSRTVRIDDEHWVIGFGHIRKSKDPYRVSREEAEQVLREYDLPPYEALVLENTYAPLHQSAFDALVSFAFNIGKDAFLGSDVLALINSGEFIAAAEAMGAWRKSKIEGRTIIVDALVRRRAAEKAMFLAHPSGAAPAPSAIVKPKLDPAAQIMTPHERAVVIETSVEGEDARAIVRPPRDERRSPSTASAEIRAPARLTQRFDALLRAEEGAAPPAPVAPPPSSAPIEGPTPEEITAAISELVNGAANETGDLEQDPGIESLSAEAGGTPETAADSDQGSDYVTLEDARRNQRFERTLGDDTDDFKPPAAHSAIIDDLEPVEIDASDIQRALLENEELEAEARGIGFGVLGVLALLSMMGAGVFAWGVSRLATNAQLASSSSISAPVVMIIVGALLFMIMSYYFMREFVRTED